MQRRQSRPPIKQPYWKQDGKQWYAEAEALRRTVTESGYSEDELRRRMGYGYAALQAVLSGARVDGWTAYHIETMLETMASG